MNSYNLPPKALELISKLPKDAKIVELGSGEGSGEIVKMGYNLLSIEAHEEWVEKYHSNYVHAKLRKYEFGTWFDVDSLTPIVDLLDCDLLIIDGPRGSEGRTNFVHFANLFEAKHYLIDDTERRGEYAIYKYLEVKTGRVGTEYTDGNKKFVWL